MIVKLTLGTFNIEKSTKSEIITVISLYVVVLVAEIETVSKIYILRVAVMAS